MGLIHLCTPLYCYLKSSGTSGRDPKMPNPAVLVTGFGPFGPHKTNASLEAVLELPSIWTNRQGDLIVEEVPVSYGFVGTAKFCMMHPERELLATVHCGVSAQAKNIMVEKCARNSFYNSPDIDGKLPSSNTCVECRPKEEKLSTKFHVHDLAKCTKADVDTSEDAGLYLCEFIYYKGLAEMKGNSIFIHVPTQDVLSSEEAAKSIRTIVETIVDKVSKKTP